VNSWTSAKTFGCFVALLSSAAFAQESYEQLLHLWDYDKTAPLSLKQAGVQHRGRATVYDISYNSPVGDRGASVGPNGRTVTSYLVVPAGKGPFPAVIYGHRGP
jgi:hypothetical protein